jgi:drug/metabolite transporter (DMT)-like permease
MQQDPRQRLLAYTGLVLTALFWAGNAVLARGVADEIRPIALAFWRWVGALAVLLPFGLAHLRRGASVIRANPRPLVAMGLLSVATFNTLLYLAAHTTTAVNIALVNSMLPVAIALLALAILGQRTTWRQVAGIAAAGAGVLTIVARGDWEVLASLAFRQGDLVMILAVLVWGLYSVLLRLWPIDLHPVGFLTLTVIIGVGLLLPAFVWEVAVYGHFAFRPIHLPLFGYLAIFPSILAFLFWNRAVAVVGPSVTGMFIYLVPVFTAVLASTILRESLYAYHATGGALILVGLYLATRAGIVSRPGAHVGGDPPEPIAAPPGRAPERGGEP